MKIKFLIAILLTLVMCLSVVLVSCTPREEGPKINNNPESDKQVISNKLSEGSIGDVFEKLESEETSLDLSELYEQIASVAISAELDLDTEWIDSVLYLAMKDGVLEAEVSDEKTYVVFDKNLSVSTLTQYGEGYWITSEEMTSSDVEFPSTEEDLEDILGISTEALDLIKGFSFPEIDGEDIALDGDWYVISDKYYEDIAKSVLDLIVEVAEVEGEETPSDEEYNEALDSVSEVIDALNLEVGFAVIGENIVGIKVCMDVDFEQMSQIGNGEITPPIATPIAKEDDIEDQKLAAAVEIWLTNDALFLSSVEISLDVDTDGVFAKGKFGYQYSYNNSKLSGVYLKADMEFAEYDDDVVSMKGQLSTNLIFDENEVCGVLVDADMDIKNIAIGGHNYETNNGSYMKYVTCVGDVTVDASLVMDISKLSEVGKKIISADIDCEVVGTSLYYYNNPDPIYDEQYDMWVSGDPIKSTDMSIFTDPPKLSDYNQSIDVYGSATVEAENKIDIAFGVKTENDTPVNVTGIINLENEKSITLPDGLDADTLAEDYARIMLRAEEIADELYYQWDICDGYYIYDAESGLYAYIASYGYVQNIGTVAPTDAEFIDQYGTYTEYGN